MRFSRRLPAIFLLVATLVDGSTIPAEMFERGTSSSPASASPSISIDPSSLLLGACLAIGTCVYGGNQQRCYTSGCLEDNLGGICSCVPDVQDVIEQQTAKGKQEWPVKCPY